MGFQEPDDYSGITITERTTKRMSQYMSEHQSAAYDPNADQNIANPYSNVNNNVRIQESHDPFNVVKYDKDGKACTDHKGESIEHKEHVHYYPGDQGAVVNHYKVTARVEFDIKSTSVTQAYKLFEQLMVKLFEDSYRVKDPAIRPAYYEGLSVEKK